MVTRSPEVSWTSIHVWAYERCALRPLAGDQRLAALFRWKNEQRAFYVWFSHGTTEVTDHATVEWTGFPESTARGAAEGPGPDVREYLAALQRAPASP